MVPPGEPAALAGALRELLADPEQRAALEARARDAAAGPFSWDAVARKTIGLYEELLR
jgi:starch synthase